MSASRQTRVNELQVRLVHVVVGQLQLWPTVQYHVTLSISRPALQKPVPLVSPVSQAAFYILDRWHPDSAILVVERINALNSVYRVVSRAVSHLVCIIVWQTRLRGHWQDRLDQPRFHLVRILLRTGNRLGRAALLAVRVLLDDSGRGTERSLHDGQMVALDAAVLLEQGTDRDSCLLLDLLREHGL